MKRQRRKGKIDPRICGKQYVMVSPRSHRLSSNVQISDKCREDQGQLFK